MNRKAQLTLFVILGLVIVIVLGLLLFFKGEAFKSLWEKETQKGIAIHPQVQNINSFVRECIKTTGDEALYLIGQQGGYFRTPERSTEFGIPYYFIKDKSYMPSKEQIEKEISSYMEGGLFFCTKNFIDFPGFDIDQGRVITKTEIGAAEVVLNVEYPLIITKDDTTFNLKDFKNIKIPIRLGIIYGVADEMIKEQLKNKNNICLSCLINLGIEKDLYINVDDYGSDSVIFTIQDMNSQLYKKPYEFVFANQYKVRR